MIKLELSTAVSMYLTFFLLIVFVIWIFYTYTKKENLRAEPKQLQQCPYCTHVFTLHEQKDTCICPNCKSYISLGDQGLSQNSKKE